MWKMSLVQLIAEGRGPEQPGAPGTAASAPPGIGNGPGPGAGAARPGRKMRPAVAGLLSAFLPGLGDLCLGHRAAACLKLLVTAAAWLTSAAFLGRVGPEAGRELLPSVGGALLVLHLVGALMTLFIARRGLQPARRGRAAGGAAGKAGPAGAEGAAGAAGPVAAPGAASAAGGTSPSGASGAPPQTAAERSAAAAAESARRGWRC